MARKQSIHRDLKQGNKLHQRGNIPAAAKAYQHHVNGNPKDKSGHYNLAVTLAAAHQVEPAILSYCRAIEIDPWYPEALNNLGILLHSKGNLVAARQCYARAPWRPVPPMTMLSTISPPPKATPPTTGTLFFISPAS